MRSKTEFCSYKEIRACSDYWGYQMDKPSYRELANYHNDDRMTIDRRSRKRPIIIFRTFDEDYTYKEIKDK